MPETRLDFLVIGAQKCATSWLYDCLKDHPEIHLPAKKKEIEYLGGDLYKQHGPDWYFGLVKGAAPGQLKGDVSVNYMSDPNSAPLVKEFIPDVKLIACLRDPIDRTISAYYWYSRKSKVPEGSIEESFEKALDRNANLDPEVRAAYDDILARGFYDEQLARYREFIPADRMHYVLYNDVSNDPAGVIKGVFKYVGVKDDFLPGSISTKPKKNTYLGFLIALERKAPNSRIVGKIADLTNQLLQKLKFSNEKPKLPKKVACALIDLYEPHVRETERIVNESRPKGQQVDLVKLWLEKWR